MRNLTNNDETKAKEAKEKRGVRAEAEAEIWFREMIWFIG